MQEICLVVIDWGTSSFRLWALDKDNAILESLSGPQGMLTLRPSDFGPLLDQKLNDLDVGPQVPVVVSGMAGAAQGWHEAPYISAPTQLDRIGAQAVRVPGLARSVHILPGVKQSHPAQVMRGEETQIAGLLQQNPGFDGVVCLPGTHTKWAKVSDGILSGFTTAMTGEQFALLSQMSVLKHAMKDMGWEKDAFLAAVLETIDQPQRIVTQLFGLRAETLIGDMTSAKAASRLSGLLIGLELAATQSYWRDNLVVLIGKTGLCDKYKIALTSQNVDVQQADGVALTVAGLIGAAACIGNTHMPECPKHEDRSSLLTRT